MSLSLSVIIAGFLLLGGFAAAEAEPQPAESALGTPRKELLESATQVTHVVSLLDTAGAPVVRSYR